MWPMELCMLIAVLNCSMDIHSNSEYLDLRVDRLSTVQKTISIKKINDLGIRNRRKIFW